MSQSWKGGVNEFFLVPFKAGVYQWITRKALLTKSLYFICWKDYYKHSGPESITYRDTLKQTFDKQWPDKAGTDSGKNRQIITNILLECK